MSQINPFTGSILQSTQVQRQQSADKDRQARRTTEQTKNAALAEDKLEHQVESSEELQPVKEDQRHERRFKRSRPKHDAKPDEQQKPHIDLTA